MESAAYVDACLRVAKASIYARQDCRGVAKVIHDQSCHGVPYLTASPPFTVALSAVERTWSYMMNAEIWPVKNELGVGPDAPRIVLVTTNETEFATGP